MMWTAFPLTVTNKRLAARPFIRRPSAATFSRKGRRDVPTRSIA